MTPVYRILLVSLAALLLSSTAGAAGIDGVFEAVAALPEKNSLSVVVFDEYINFTCPHCNNFRKAAKGLKEKYSGRIKVNYIPILFPRQSEFPLRLFYIAQREGRGVEIKNLIFDAAFGHGVNVYDPAVVNYLARSTGLWEKYRQEGQAQWVSQRLQAGFSAAGLAGVRATPTVVLQGAIRVQPKTGMKAFVGNLDRIIQQLLKPAS